MAVKDKQPDIAILRTIGARPSSILAIFTTQGTVIGLASPSVQHDLDLAAQQSNER